MKNKYLQIILAILCLNLLSPEYLLSQQARSKKRIVTVKDENGNPVPNAVVTIGEGGAKVRTNNNGEFSIKGDTLVPVLIEADGFESQLIEASLLPALNNVVLAKAEYQLGEKDRVFIPYGSIKKRRIAGAVTALSPDEILKYDQTGVSGLMNGRVPGMFGTSSIRGMKDPVIIIDGIPRPLSSVNPQEVEQISILKDPSITMLYGPQAANGVILINTKRGKPLEKLIRFTATTGLDKAVSYPKYLHAADYMELYNEALDNDGLAPKFSQEEINNTRNGVNPVRYPDESYYNSTYLNNWATSYNVVGETSGGNEVAKYYVNLGWQRNNSFLKVGHGAGEKYDRFNVRGNIDYKLSDMISARLDGAVMFNLYNGPRYTDPSEDFWSLSTTLHPEWYPVLIPENLLTDSTLSGAAKLVNGHYILGGTSEHLTNMYGELTLNGLRKINERLVQISTGLDFNLNSLTKGLKASAFVSFDMDNLFQTDLLNSYAVYEPVYFGDSLAFSKYGDDVKVDNQTVTNTNYYRQLGFYGKIDYARNFGDHDIMITGLAYRDEYNQNNTMQPAKHLNFGLRANYTFKNKYIAQFTGVVAGSPKLYSSASYAFSPGIGLGWIVTEEKFLKNSKFLDYLKMRVNGSLINTLEPLSNYYLDQNLYNEGSAYSFDEGKYYNYAQILSAGNPNLGWEKRMNVNVGFESMFFEYKLGLEGTYFYNKAYDQISQESNKLPVYFASLPYMNYGSEQLQGAEIGMSYRIDIGEFGIKLNGNIVYSVPKVLSMDELDYPDEYRKHVGKPSDAIFGLVALGFFRDQEDIDNSPYQAFGSVQPGDIKYKDLNNDHVINDDDQMMIGNSRSRISYGLSLNFTYKSFELFALGTGQGGQDRIFNNAYYWVYGNRKYSEVVWNRWTPETASTATYPRLTSKSNANNFRTSTFWLENNNWFTLQTLQLTYTLNLRNVKWMDNPRFYIRGYNLLKVSKIKDKTELNVGSRPQTRRLAFGLIFQF